MGLSARARRSAPSASTAPAPSSPALPRNRRLLIVPTSSSSSGVTASAVTSVAAGERWRDSGPRVGPCQDAEPAVASGDLVDEEPAQELGLEPRALGRHHVPAIGDRHELLHR